METNTTIFMTETKARSEYDDVYMDTETATLKFHDISERGTDEINDDMKKVIGLISDWVGEEDVLKFIIERYGDSALNRLGFYSEKKILSINDGLELQPEFYLVGNYRMAENVVDINKLYQFQIERLIKEESKLVQVVDHKKLFNKIGGKVLVEFRKTSKKIKENAKKALEKKRLSKEKKKERQIELAQKLLEKEGRKVI